MACRIMVVPEVRAWLEDLRENDPPAATLVDDALNALAEGGRSLGPPLVVPLGMDHDPGPAAEDWYQRQLANLREVHRSLAEVATSRSRADLNLDETESAVARAEDRLRHALDQADTRQAGQIQAELSSQRDLLDGMREARAELDHREHELAGYAARAAAVADLYRLHVERIKADYLSQRAATHLADAEKWVHPPPSTDDGPTSEMATRPSPPLLWELRPARFGQREIVILFAAPSTDAAVMLHAGSTDDMPTWYRDAIRSALTRWSAFNAEPPGS